MHFGSKNFRKVKKSAYQCDQMALLFFNIFPLTRMKFAQTQKINQSRLNNLTNIAKLTKAFENFPKWRNFAQSGHTGHIIDESGIHCYHLIETLRRTSR